MKIKKIAKIFFMLITCAIYSTINSIESKITSNKELSIKMPKILHEIIENKKILCFTRFVMNIPSTTIIVYGRLSTGGELTRIPNSADKINKLIIEDIERNSRDSQLFSSDQEIDNLAGKILPTRDPRIKQVLGVTGYEKYSIHTYFQLGEDTYLITSNSVTPSFVQRTLWEDIEVVNHLRPREDEEIPQEPGICIDGAFSTLETPFESIEFGVRLTNFPDVHFSLQTIKNADGLMSVDLQGDLKESQQEARDAGLGTWANRLKILRQRKRVVNDWHGEEMLLRVPSGYGKPSHHKFMFRSAGAIQDPLHPFVEMTLDTGIKDNKTASVEPSLSDDEALALWDWLLNSIRVRPNAVAAKASAPARPGA